MHAEIDESDSCRDPGEKRVLEPARLTDERHQVRLGLRRRTSVRHAEKLELVVAADEHAAEPLDAAWGPVDG